MIRAYLVMSDDLTVKPWSDQRSLPGNDYWRIAREIKKQEAVYPTQSREMIKSAVELAFNTAGVHRDPRAMDRFVAMYLTSAKVQ